MPERIKARGASRQLSVLSAGCSSGEEAFSLVIALKETVPQPPWSVSIRAVDVNPAALARAASGRFSNWALRDTPPATQQRWFTPVGRELALDDEIRASVQFSQRNLTADDGELWPADHYDVIFCRNVIMYFSPEVQQAVVARIARSLAPGGFLFLGHAETLRGLSQRFQLVHTPDTFYYQRREGAEEDRRVRGLSPAAAPPAPEVRPVAAADASWFQAIGSATRRIEALSLPQAIEPAGPVRRNLVAALELLQRERYEEALTVLHGVPTDAPVDPDVLLLRAVLLVQGGQVTAGADACRRLLAQDEMNAGANYVLALCCEAADDREAAMHLYRVAAYLDHGFAMPRLHLGLMARRSGDRETARTELTQALDLLRHEEAARVLMFGGGFTRDGLAALCEAELRGVESRP
jgi:chemotaxis protein methyltransferase CheR